MGRIFTQSGTVTLDSQTSPSKTVGISTVQTVNPDSALTLTKTLSKTNVETLNPTGTTNWLLCKVFRLNEATSLTTDIAQQKTVGIATQSIMTVTSDLTANLQRVLTVVYSETANLQDIAFIVKTRTFVPYGSFDLTSLLERALTKSFPQTNIINLLSDIVINQAASRNVLSYSESETPSSVLFLLKTVSYTPSELATLAESLGRSLSKSMSQTASIIESGTVGLAKSLSKATSETVTLLSDFAKTQSVAVRMVIEKFDNLTVNSTFQMSFLPYSAPTNWELYFMFACVMLLVVVAIGVLNEKKN
jgi:hypothetical protein